MIIAVGPFPLVTDGAPERRLAPITSIRQGLRAGASFPVATRANTANFEFPLVAYQAASGIRLLLTNAAKDGPTAGGGSSRLVEEIYTLDNTTLNPLHCHIRVTAPGGRRAFATLGGSTDIVIPPYSIRETDILPIDVAAGDVLTIRAYVSDPTGALLPMIGSRYLPRASIEYGTDAPDKTNTGAAIVPGTFGNLPTCPVIAGVLGYVLASEGSKAVVCVGHSIVLGIGDTDAESDNNTPTDYGFCNRACVSRGLAAVVPATGGSQTANWNDNHKLRGMAFRVHNVKRAVWMYGTNDLAGGRSAVDLIARTTVGLAELDAHGVQTIVCTEWPRSAGAGLDTAPKVAARAAYNDWVRAKSGGARSLPGVIAICDVGGVGGIEAAPVNSNNAIALPGGTWEGLHGDPVFHRYCANILAATMATVGWGN